jgi:hypothetical protein
LRVGEGTRATSRGLSVATTTTVHVEPRPKPGSRPR